MQMKSCATIDWTDCSHQVINKSNSSTDDFVLVTEMMKAIESLLTSEEGDETMTEIKEHSTC